jgi:hypothetical protein
MRKLFGKVATAAAAGVLAVVVVSSPALAVGVARWGEGDIELLRLHNDADTITLGEVRLVAVGNGQTDLMVCDYYSDGYYVVGQIKATTGRLINYQSLGVGPDNCYTRTLGYDISDFRILWKDYTSPWY